MRPSSRHGHGCTDTALVPAVRRTRWHQPTRLSLPLTPRRGLRALEVGVPMTDHASSPSRSRTRGRRRRTSRDSTPAEQKLALEVSAMLLGLPELERAVISRRLGLHDGSTMSLAATARDLGIGRTEASEIEHRAMKRLRRVIGPDQARQVLARYR